MVRKGDGSSEEALKRAVRFLSYRSRSEAEVQTKLTQLGFPAKVVEETIKRLRALNYLNDEAFARAWAQGMTEGRGYGPLRIERDLRQKGIAKSVISRILGETFGSQEGKERAKMLLEKRFRGKDLHEAKTLRRAVSFLQRRGYRDSVIAELLRQPLGDD
jgi:regulatory protein